MVVKIVQMTYINAITSKLKWHKRAIKSNLKFLKRFGKILANGYLNPKNPDT